MRKKLEENYATSDDEFVSFFAEVLSKLPVNTAKIIKSTYQTTRRQADKVRLKSQGKFDQVADTFLMGVDDETRKKCHRIIHVAALSAAVIGCSPIPFSDAFLLVPVQLTMMSRLHKLFGQSWSENLGKNLSKELVVVSLGRSAVGNIIKFVPVVGTVSGAAINASVAVSITESLGWVTVKMLNDGEDIFEQAMSFKGQFNLLFNSIHRFKSPK